MEDTHIYVEEKHRAIRIGKRRGGTKTCAEKPRDAIVESKGAAMLSSQALQAPVTIHTTPP